MPSKVHYVPPPPPAEYVNVDGCPLPVGIALIEAASIERMRQDRWYWADNEYAAQQRRQDAIRMRHLRAALGL